MIPLFWWVIAAAAFGAIVMSLWNALMPGLFGLAVLNYWQALGLLVLARLLFGGIGRRHGMIHGRMGHGMGGENPIHAKWMKMTPEEREQFVKKRKAHMMHGGLFGRPGFFGGCDFSQETEKLNSQKNNE